jgi:hypothetical protein
LADSLEELILTLAVFTVVNFMEVDFMEVEIIMDLVDIRALEEIMDAIVLEDTIVVFSEMIMCILLKMVFFFIGLNVYT